MDRKFIFMKPFWPQRVVCPCPRSTYMYLTIIFKLCQPCPWGQIWPCNDLQWQKLKTSLKPQGPELLYFVCSNVWGSIISLDFTWKTSKFNISKASRQILIKLHTQHHWAEGKVAFCFWTDRLELCLVDSQ